MSTTTTVKKEKTNLFSTATKVVAESKSKPEHKTIIVSDLASKPKELQQLRDQIAALEAKAEIVEGDIKNVARRVFSSEYEQQKRRPDSFILAGIEGQMLVIMQDRYLSVKEEKAEYLKGKYGDDILEIVQEYSMNKELVQQYGQEISDALMKAKIPDEVKGQLIQCKEKTQVKKGTIERVLQFGEAKLVIADIEPICQLKKS